MAESRGLPEAAQLQKLVEIVPISSEKEANTVNLCHISRLNSSYHHQHRVEPAKKELNRGKCTERRYHSSTELKLKKYTRNCCDLFLAVLNDLRY